MGEGGLFNVFNQLHIPTINFPNVRWLELSLLAFGCKKRWMLLRVSIVDVFWFGLGSDLFFHRLFY